MANPNQNTQPTPMAMPYPYYNPLWNRYPASPNNTVASSPNNISVTIRKHMSQHSNGTFGHPPLTPNPTPPEKTVADSFGDEQNFGNEQAAIQHIERLASGHNITEDFVPNWRTTLPPTLVASCDEDRGPDVMQAAHTLMAMKRAESKKHVSPPPNSNDFSRALTGHIAFSHDSTLSNTEDENESEYESPMGIREGEAKSSRGGERSKEQTTHKTTNKATHKATKKATATTRTTTKTTTKTIKKKAKTKRKAGAAPKSNGDGKKKSRKDVKLGEIKLWLNSKTKKCLLHKEPGDTIKLDLTSDYKSLDFARLPDLGSHMCIVEQPDDKLAPKGKYDGGDPTDLHEGELALAEAIDLSYDQYRCQKRRLFAARAVYHQHRRNHPDLALKALSPSWTKTQTQLVGSVDANKSSRLYEAFNQWKWFDTMEEKWDKEYLERITNDFELHEKE